MAGIYHSQKVAGTCRHAYAVSCNFYMTANDKGYHRNRVALMKNTYLGIQCVAAHSNFNF